MPKNEYFKKNRDFFVNAKRNSKNWKEIRKIVKKLKLKKLKKKNPKKKCPKNGREKIKNNHSVGKCCAPENLPPSVNS